MIDKGDTFMKNHLSKYKFSKYNHKIALEGDLFLYNALSGGFCKVDADIKDILEKCDLTSNILEIRDLPQDIIDELIKGGFLLEKDIDEFKLIKSIHNVSRFSNNNSLNLTLLPTLGCNFRCTYCFEKEQNYPNTKMTKEVMDAIIKLIDERLNSGGNLGISWYGGEPLIHFDIVEELQSRINEIAIAKNLNLKSSMVTNGYLLTKEVSDKLVNLGIKSVQITIDGPKKIHDQKRILVNGKGSFDKIISNLIEINENLYISIRVNIEKNNIDTIPEFLDFLNEIGICNKKNIAPYFAVVRDFSNKKGSLSDTCYTISDYSKEEIYLSKIAYEKGFDIGERLTPNLSSCGAISPNMLLIEPDGTIQKCWNSVGDSKESVGHLIDTNIDSLMITKNKSEWYSWSSFEDEECKNCKVLPLCMGGCPYYSINQNEVYKNSNYRCVTGKFNLEDTLKMIAYRHLNKKCQMERR